MKTGKRLNGSSFSGQFFQTLEVLFIWLWASAVWAQQGLRGDYYAGTNFERKVYSRVDPQLSFDWHGRSPAPGLPQSYYSIRWTGKLLAPATGEYRFYAKVDDGIRLWVGNKKVMDSWQLNDSQNFRGSVILEAGKYYDLRVDFFNDMLEGEIILYWERPDTKRRILNPFAPPGDPISANYFFQKAVPGRVVPPKAPAQMTLPAPLTVTASAKPLPIKRPATVAARPLPVARPVSAKKAVIIPVATEIPSATLPPVETSPKPAFSAGTTFVLHNVQFEQSSYVLLPESSTELDKLVRAMKENPERAIEVSGHTDNVGDPRLNMALSENRAKVVAAYLKRRGITDDRMTIMGYGGTRPIADNTTEGERARNRRVEIAIR